MKRTLAISLLWASGVGLAQNPAAGQKNVQTAVKASTAAQTATVSVKPSPTTVKVTPVSTAKPTATKENKAEEKKPATAAKSVGQAGRRDPFLSPVVNLGAVGSGCSSGKRCLAIDAISLRGIVKSDNGMISVVVNATDKAYFLRENDPVFNGYVIKITGDSVVFKETFHDRLGKPLTRDITKTINRPVA